MKVKSVSLQYTIAWIIDFEDGRDSILWLTDDDIPEEDALIQKRDIRYFEDWFEELSDADQKAFEEALQSQEGMQRRLGHLRTLMGTDEEKLR
jgi:hypothetical protein